MSDRVLVMREGRQMGDLRRRRPRTGADHDGRGGCRVSNVVTRWPWSLRRNGAATRRAWLRPERVKGLSLVAVLVATILLFSVVVDDYLSARFVSRLLIAVSITAMLAAGESLVIITRNIDLSVGLDRRRRGVPHRRAAGRPPGAAGGRRGGVRDRRSAPASG